ncbi:MAG: transporter substrate-binding domain-containing protein [Cocleimonas sp.]|nr:transporter substrate-binding domain-containing protein [Cocleimonas sp.]
MVTVKADIHQSNPQKKIHLTPKEKDFLINHPVIRVGVDPAWTPIEFLDDEGKHQGISAQYLEYCEMLLQVKFEVVKGLSWAEAYKKLERSELDVLPAVSITPKRKELFNFTRSYLKIPNAIFSDTNTTFLGDLDTLKKKKVVTIEGYASKDWLISNYPEIELVTVPNLRLALQKIDKREAFAFLGNLITTSYYIGQTRLIHIRVAGDTVFSNHLAMAIRKDWEILPTILQKALDAISSSEKRAIYNSWISIKYDHEIDYSLLWKVLGIVTVLLLLTFTYWNYRLSKEIAQHQKTERKLKIAKRGAEAATQAKSRFLSHMSHELRTPLNAILGLEYLIQKTTLTHKQQNYMTKMRSSSESLLNLINNILDFSKGEVGRIILNSTAFNLNKVLRKIEHILRPIAENKALRLMIECEKDVPIELIGDAEKLEQVLLNFGSNALKFTDQGVVLISVTILEQYHRAATLCFTISDTGIGISPDRQKIIFSPFLQEDVSIGRNFGGTGLGLTICQQFVQLMQGEITLHSKKGEGSQFTFSAKFKISKQNEATHLLPRKQGRTKKLQLTKKIKTISVLIVDDNELNLFLFEQLLLDIGIKATTANNGQEAINCLKKEMFDIIFMDIQMPIMNGYEAVTIIRTKKQWWDLPIIAITAATLEGEKDKCIAVGMNDYMSKPIDPILFYKILTKWS